MERFMTDQNGKTFPVLKCTECVKYREIAGRGWCGNRRVSPEDAERCVVCTRKGAGVRRPE